MKGKQNSKHERFIAEIRQQVNSKKNDKDEENQYIDLPEFDDNSEVSILLQKKLEEKFEELFGPLDEG